MYTLFFPEHGASIAHFALIEITRIWDWNADAQVPANASAGLLINAILLGNGQDKDGAPYIPGAMNVALSSGLFDEGRTAQTYPSSESNLARLRASFAWNLYCFQG